MICARLADGPAGDGQEVLVGLASSRSCHSLCPKFSFPSAFCEWGIGLDLGSVDTHVAASDHL